MIDGPPLLSHLELNRFRMTILQNHSIALLHIKVWGMEADAPLGLAARSSNSLINSETKPPSTSLEAWTGRDHPATVVIFPTSSQTIVSAQINLLSDPETQLPRPRTIYDSLCWRDGTSGPQYSFTIGRKFIGNRCGEGEDVVTNAVGDASISTCSSCFIIPLQVVRCVA